MDCKTRILADDYYDVITDYPIPPGGEANFDLCVVDIEDKYQLVYVNKEQIGDPENYFFEHLNIPKLYGLMGTGISGMEMKNIRNTYAERTTDRDAMPGADMNEADLATSEIANAAEDINLVASGISQIQKEPLSLTGRGCVIVFIDTGIDYTNPIFRRPDGSSRILAIWDQTIQTGTPPQGILYGSEYTREDINRALTSSKPYEIVPSRDEIGHGSNLAAAAAGGNTIASPAPDADIVVVKLKQAKEYLRQFYMVPRGVPAYEETDIMMGLLYGERFADFFKRPTVYCIGLGTNYGDHEGNSSLSRYIEQIAIRRSRAVVICGGNEGNTGHHFQSNPYQVMTNRNIPVEVRVGENADGFILEFWGNIPDVFTMSIRSPGGESIPSIRLGLEEIVTYSFIYERTRITIAGMLVESGSGQELITLRVERPTAGIWTFQVEAVGEIHNGIFNMWLPITQFMNTDVYFLEGTPYITLTEPALAPDAIAVSTYNGANGSFYSASGRGFSGTGIVKPDFAAPGVNVTGAFLNQTGSSAAAAITAGAVAQFMQWAVIENNNRVVESREIKSYLSRGATRTYGIDYPNREWGYGRLNMVGTFNALVGV